MRPRSFSYVVRRMKTRLPETAENGAQVVEDSFSFDSRSIENQWKSHFFCFRSSFCRVNAKLIDLRVEFVVV